MRTSVRTALGALGLVVMSTAASSSMAAAEPASAAGAKAGCPEGSFCLYDDANWTAPMISVDVKQGPYVLPEWARNKASSYENNTDHCVVISDWTTLSSFRDVLYHQEDLGKFVDYPHEAGGSWDNRIDEIDTQDSDCL
ncbi:peptidase inhibitor family I36 protein [Saccharopolyspora tripterygii]